jgi:hypothetical protein
MAEVVLMDLRVPIDRCRDSWATLAPETGATGDAADEADTVIDLAILQAAPAEMRIGYPQSTKWPESRTARMTGR